MIPNPEWDPIRQVRYSVAASLDGFIAGPGGEYDWTPEEPRVDFQAFLEKIDTILNGRKTFEVVLEGGGLASLPKVPVIAFSYTLEPGEQPDHTVVSGDAADFVRRLKGQEGRGIWLFGGGRLFGSLLAAGVVDLAEVAIVPVMLGDGVPLVDIQRLVHLELERTESFPSGILLNRYRIKKTT